MSGLRNNSLQWYQSKGIKGTNIEGQIDLLNVMIKSGSNAPGKQADLNELLQQLQRKDKRYEAEKNEILLGSRQISKGEWMQELDCGLGQVALGKEYELNIEKLGNVHSSCSSS